MATSGGSGAPSALEGQNDANTGEPGIEYTLPTTLTDQADLLVAHHTGTYATESTSGVPLHFHHALSRIKFQAKGEGSKNFVVKSIKLKNIKSKASLDLSSLPQDATPFVYPTNAAEVVTPSYATYWVPDGSTVVDLTAALTTDTVKGVTTGWTDVVGGDDALYVIRRQTLLLICPEQP
ncbi:hypothetical protein AGMMS49525_03510 [Bacteroidia bacterium]|nr:hypothetical protein AGMMS49525_03510 [Bacteroidia bacterium]